MRVEKREPTTVIDIHICGDGYSLNKALSDYCKIGFCISVIPCGYIYTEGAESGWLVRIINYPRFPKSRNDLKIEAINLADLLLFELGQESCSVICPDETIYIQVKEKS